MLTLIFDSNYLLHRCMKVPDLAELQTSTGMYTGGVFGYLRSIRDVMGRFYPDVVYAVFDGGISVRRRKDYPPYKGPKYRDRDDPYYEKPDDDDLNQYLERFTKQRRQLSEILPCLGIRVVRFKAEADDVICALSHIIDTTVSIVSDDKDMLQLVRDGVVVYRPSRQQIVTCDNFKARFGMDRDSYQFCKAVLGDKSDCIAKVEGVGEETVNVLIKELGDRFGVIYPFTAVFEYCRIHGNRRINKIYEQRDIVLRNYKLICFDFEPMEDIYGGLSQITNQPVFVDKHRVSEYFKILELNRLLGDFNEWVVPFQKLS